jgi:hypothetical protein
MASIRLAYGDMSYVIVSSVVAPALQYQHEIVYTVRYLAMRDPPFPVWARGVGGGVSPFPWGDIVEEPTAADSEPARRPQKYTPGPRPASRTAPG